MSTIRPTTRPTDCFPTRPTQAAGGSIAERVKDLRDRPIPSCFPTDTLSLGCRAKDPGHGRPAGPANDPGHALRPGLAELAPALQEKIERARERVTKQPQFELCGTAQAEYDRRRKALGPDPFEPKRR